MLLRLRNSNGLTPKTDNLTKVAEMKTGNKFANADKIYCFFIQMLWQICTTVTSQVQLTVFVRDHLTLWVEQCVLLTADSEDVTHDAMEPLLRVIVAAYILNVNLPAKLAHVMSHMEVTDITVCLEKTFFQHKVKRPFGHLLLDNEQVFAYIKELTAAVIAWRVRNFEVRCKSLEDFKACTNPKFSLWKMCTNMACAVLHNFKSWIMLCGNCSPILFADNFKMAAAFADMAGFHFFKLKYLHWAEKLSEVSPLTVRLRRSEKVLLCMLSVICVFYMTGWIRTQNENVEKLCLLGLMLKPMKHFAGFGTVLMWSVPIQAAKPDFNQFLFKIDFDNLFQNNIGSSNWNFSVPKYFAFPKVELPKVELPNVEFPAVNISWPTMDTQAFNFPWLSINVSSVVNNFQAVTVNILQNVSTAIQPWWVAGNDHLAYMAHQARHSEETPVVLTNATKAWAFHDWRETVAKMWVCEMSTEVAVWNAPETGLEAVGGASKTGLEAVGGAFETGLIYLWFLSGVVLKEGLAALIFVVEQPFIVIKAFVKELWVNMTSDIRVGVV
jgi:hypothetical protein